MDNDGNKIIWTVVIISAIAIMGLMFINFMPSQTSNIKTAIGNELNSFGNGTKSDSSSSNPNVGPNLLINTSSSATNGCTELQGTNATASGSHSRTNSYEQLLAPSSGEFFYRFVWYDQNKLYGLTPGETYTLSGSASHTTGELVFRVGYSTNGKDWNGSDTCSNLGIPVSDGSVFTPFSQTFTIPANATGIHFGLQNFNYTNGSLFRFKNMKLVKVNK